MSQYELIFVYKGSLWLLNSIIMVHCMFIMKCVNLLVARL